MFMEDHVRAPCLSKRLFSNGDSRDASIQEVKDWKILKAEFGYAGEAFIDSQAAEEASGILCGNRLDLSFRDTQALEVGDGFAIIE